MNRLYSGSGIILFGIVMIVSGWREVILLRIASIMFLSILGILMIKHSKELNDAILGAAE